MGAAPLYAWYGDDFTGASDTLATVAASGLRTALFLAPPSPEQLAIIGPLDAIGIAGTARALNAVAMRKELAPVAAFFADTRPLVTHYKCCSTYDSAPEVGNLHLGAQSLRRAEHTGPLLILGGQPSLGRYCAFGELFATAHQGGDVYRIDRHPTMSRHPVTPMHEADLRRHLTAQGMALTALVDLRQLDAADDEDGTLLAHTINDHAQRGAQAVLFDATREPHLARIGRAWWERAHREPVLALGASGVAQALIKTWPVPQSVQPTPAGVAAAIGPVFVLVGSLSPVTAVQVAAAGEAYAVVEVNVAALIASDAALDRLAARCADLLASGRSVLARTTAARDTGLSPIAVAQATGRLLAQVIAKVPQLRRIGVAGGDTSSWALRAIGPWALQWAGSFAPGVALLRARADQPHIDGLELVLKGGQMGPPDLFGRLVAGTG